MAWKTNSSLARSGSAALAALVCLAASAQAPAKPACPDASKPCSQSSGHTPGAAERFPYPGEAKPPSPAPAQEQFPYPGESTPEAPAAAKPANSAAGQFPYPGEKPVDDSASGSSSSSSAGDNPVPAASDGKPAIKDEGSEGDSRPHRRRLRPQAQKTLSNEERVEEDLTVAHFYQQSGNAMGAYLRAKDAVKLQPQLGDTHMALALAADRLGKRDEAIAEYKAALAGDLESSDAKAARKALDRLKP